tara:strand:- start:557 stop:769 length:213 start_codon:yes stop_codon:yes gene_type:complete
MLMREKVLKALLAHAQGDLQKHLANIEVIMNNPVGVADHPNIIDSIEAELHMAAKYEEQLNLINKYLKGS